MIFTTSSGLGVWDFALKPPPEIHPWTPLVDFRPQSVHPNLPTPEKNSAGAPGHSASGAILKQLKQ